MTNSKKYDKARVVAVHRERYEVSTTQGAVLATLKGSIYHHQEKSATFPVVGDWVHIDYNPTGPSRIVETLKRKSVFSRQDPDERKGEQIVAANFDYVFIVMSLNNDFNQNRLARYVTISWESGAQPVILLTKADLVPDYSDYVAQAQSVGIGVPVLPISTKEDWGLTQLAPFLEAGKTIVFLGSSGVGKSTLVNTLAGTDVMKTKSIRQRDDKGQHTTTHRQLITLPNGAMLIDTPGMRELGVWQISNGIEDSFADVEAIFSHCRFTDCGHTNEPGCKVRESLDSGHLTHTRWESYLKLQREAHYQADRWAYLQEVKRKARKK